MKDILAFIFLVTFATCAFTVNKKSNELKNAGYKKELQFDIRNGHICGRNIYNVLACSESIYVLML